MHFQYPDGRDDAVVNMHICGDTGHILSPRDSIGWPPPPADVVVASRIDQVNNSGTVEEFRITTRAGNNGPRVVYRFRNPLFRPGKVHLSTDVIGQGTIIGSAEGCHNPGRVLSLSYTEGSGYTFEGEI